MWVSPTVVSHDIALSGSTMTLTANQRVAATLSVSLNATGPGAMATITQTGEGSTALILGSIDSGAELIFNQSGIGADYALDAELAPYSKLTFNQEADGGLPVGSRVVLTTGQTVVMTHSHSERSTPVITTR